MFAKLGILLLVCLPLAAQLAVLPIVNRIDPVILGLPFFQFWLFLWILLSPLCTYGIYRIQKAQGRLD